MLTCTGVRGFTGAMKTYLNPDTLPKNPAFSQAIVVEDATRTIYVGGQNAVTPEGKVVGETIGDQTRQALRNLEAALAAADAGLSDVVRWTITVVDGQPLTEGFAAFREVWGDQPDPPTIGVHVVAGLANPAFLVEIDAIAVT
jgi:enamine deaminase RidA (YjgF/YER057c/UK114 family)